MDQFLGAEVENKSPEEAKIAVLPVPYDGTSSWLKGADRGPEMLLEASTHIELYDIETASEFWHVGIHTAEPIVSDSVTEMNNKVENAVNGLLDQGLFVATLGGEHSISYGAIKAHAERFKDLTVLQFDAHTDLRDDYDGDPFSHACVMARAQDLGVKIVSVGIRAIDKSELPRIKKTKVLYGHEIRRNPNWISELKKSISGNVYISFDLDAFDPSIMPSTGTPEPGGLLWDETLEAIKMVNESCNIVGLDIVELLPLENRAPEFLAAKLLYKMLAYKFYDRSKG